VCPIALLGLATTLSAQTPAANSLLQREVGRALERLGAANAFNERMKLAATPQAALQLGFALAHHGIGRLDPPTLQARAEILQRLFAGADEATCAQWTRGNLDPVRATGLIGSLDSTTTSRWAEISARAMVAEMNATVPVALPSDSAARGAFLSVTTVLNARERARFVDVLQRLGSASDAETCWFSRTVYAGVLRLPAERRGTTLSVLARLESQ
jgi:hypothetical protein